MTERPILFNDEMVRAILDGSKTQTRRPVKLVGAEVVKERDDRRIWPWSPQHDGWLACPFGAPGDRLWVREAWRVTSSGRHYPTGKTTIYIDWRAGRLTGALAPQHQAHFTCSDEESDALTLRAYGRGKTAGDVVRWRSSTQMPRWASRLTLRVTDVRVERVQDITEADSIAEGAGIARIQDARAPSRGPIVDAFSNLWDAAYPGSWDQNDWVWVITFEREQP